MNIAAILKSKGSEVMTAKPDTPIPEAVERMKSNGVGALLISTDGRNLLGLLSERDVLLGLAKHGANVVKQRAREIMREPEAVCSPDDSLKRVMQMMTTKRARQLPALDCAASGFRSPRTAL